MNQATADNGLVSKHITTFICRASIVVSETALGVKFEKLMAMSIINVHSLQKIARFKSAHVAIIHQHEQSDIDAVRWTFNNSYSWKFSRLRILHRVEAHDCSHAEAETRIPYFIQLGGINHENDVTSVISNESDCPAISTGNRILRYHNIVHRVSDQYIYMDTLFQMLIDVDIHCELVPREYITGGYNLNPFLSMSHNLHSQLWSYVTAN